MISHITTGFFVLSYKLVEWNSKFRLLTELVFVYGEKLPWVTEAVKSIYNYAPGGSAKKRKKLKRREDAVNAYIKSLIEIWSKAFGSENIMERKTG